MIILTVSAINVAAAIFDMPHIGQNINISSKVGYFKLLEQSYFN